jgi:U3 small nucleolar RNA-associated protein 18
MNMTTQIDGLKFNASSEFLMMRSESKKDALKVVHMATRTVFANWPTQTTPLSYATAFDVSPGSEFMAIGNDKGRVLMYRLQHFSN